MKTVFGLLAGNVAGLHRKQVHDCESVYPCAGCGAGIAEREKCIACLVLERDLQTASEKQHGSSTFARAHYGGSILRKVLRTPHKKHR
jgi:hypothetical protein